MDQAKLRIGLIGCGGMGTALGRACNRLANASVVAVADPLEAGARTLGEELGAVVETDHQRLLARDDVEAVIVASPGFLHKGIVLDAVSAHKHIFCEKPLALNVADCRTMIGAADAAGVQLMVGQVLRFTSMYPSILNVVRSGQLGKSIGAAITRISGTSWGRLDRGWRHRFDQSGGLLMEVNAHEFDMFRQICGDADSVYADMGRYVRLENDYPDNIHVLVRFKNGAIGHLHSSLCASVNQVHGYVQGDAGSLAYRDGRDGYIEYSQFGHESTRVPRAELTIMDGPQHELGLFYGALLASEPMPIPAIDGLRAVELAEAAHRSADTRQVVSLPL